MQTGCLDRTFVHAMIYMDRLAKSKDIGFYHQNARRLVATSILIALQMNGEHILDVLEKEFLQMIDYDTIVTVKDVCEYNIQNKILHMHNPQHRVYINMMTWLYNLNDLTKNQAIKSSPKL